MPLRKLSERRRNAPSKALLDGWAKIIESMKNIHHEMEGLLDQEIDLGPDETDDPQKIRQRILDLASSFDRYCSSLPKRLPSELNRARSDIEFEHDALIRSHTGM